MVSMSKKKGASQTAEAQAEATLREKQPPTHVPPPQEVEPTSTQPMGPADAAKAQVAQRRAGKTRTASNDKAQGKAQSKAQVQAQDEVQSKAQDGSRDKGQVEQRDSKPNEPVGDERAVVKTSEAQRVARPVEPEKLVRPAKVAEVPRSITTKPADPRRWLITQLQATLQEGKSEVAGIRRRLQITYWSMIVLTVGLFVFGTALIGFPALAYYRDSIEQVTFAGLGGAGALIIALLLYFRPLERLQTMLADATYVSLIKDSFQYQVTLRLLALDLDDSKTVSEAASHVSEAAQASMDLVYTQLQARRAAGG